MPGILAIYIESLEVLCDTDTAHAIIALRERYCENYSMVMYVGEVDVLRSEKF